MLRIKAPLSCGVLIMAIAILPGFIRNVSGYASQLPDTAHDRPALTGIQWKLIELEGEAVPHGSPDSYLILGHGEASAAGVRGQVLVSDSSNEYRGIYIASGQSMHIRVLTSTLVAVLVGPSNSSPPKSFTDILGAVARFEMRGQRLELLSRSGVVLARMEAIPGKTN
jgi:hypothetical protein